MKLFTKYSRVNIVASILALLLGSIGYYFAVRYVLVHQLDSTLKIEEEEILDFVHNRDQLPARANYRDQKVLFMPATAPVSSREAKCSLLRKAAGCKAALAAVQPGASNGLSATLI